jgi:DNA topoisomerase-1
MSKKSNNPKSLVIVESPAKANTIEKFLGSDYIVKSSIGHIRDLPKKGMSIDIEKGFIPQYEVNPDKKKTVSELKKLAKDAETVWLATDEDREGEAIAWHLYEALKLDDLKTKRIVFHEITKNAILNAIQNPRKIDKQLVDAQQARRVLDRLVGYELSPVLWKKVRTGLSAGRVQSVTVRLIVEREKEIENFESESSFKVTAEFITDTGKKFKAELKNRIPEFEKAKSFLESLKGAEFTIEDVKKKPSVKKPSPPFTTSTLQQEASRKLGFSVKQTMVVAQKLYESGKITYMRTDSLNLSDTAIAGASKNIKNMFGDEYSQPRRFSAKTKGAQEAHEAIRPTNMDVDSVSGDNNQKRLYELIWKRTTASQMADAKLEKTTATINISTSDEKFVAQGEIIKFDGFLKLYLESTDDENEENGNDKILPPLKKGQELTAAEIIAKEIFKRPAPRYTEASLVKKLEEMGIGRPSTYAPTISTVQDRGYVEKTSKEGVKREYKVISLTESNLKVKTESEITGAEKNKLFPTDTGTVVNDFLVKYFPDIVDFNFTAKVEEEFDEISKGKKVWNKMISEFYSNFHESVEESDNISKSDAISARHIGDDPKTGKPIFARLGKYGPMLQMGETESEDKPKFASLMKNQSITSITLDEALKMFKLPRKIGQDKEGNEVVAQIGRFGPYVRHQKTFASITEEELFTITLDDALQKITDKSNNKNKNLLKEFDGSDIKVMNGRYGPYVTNGKVNAKIPKDTEPTALELADAEELIKNAPTKKKRGAAKTTKKK